MDDGAQILKKVIALEKQFSKLESRVTKLEGGTEISTSSKNKLESMGLKLRGKVETVGQQNLIIIALKYKPRQSKTDLLNVLLSWGVKKTIYKWFKGGNLNNRLLNKGIIMKDGVNSNGDDLFSLTIAKGIPLAEDLIKKYAL